MSTLDDATLSKNARKRIARAAQREKRRAERKESERAAKRALAEKIKTEFHEKVNAMTREEREAFFAERAANLQEQLQASVEMTKSLLFSSATIAATDFFALGELVVHEELRDRGLLRFADSVDTLLGERETVQEVGLAVPPARGRGLDSRGGGRRPRVGGHLVAAAKDSTLHPYP